MQRIDKFFKLPLFAVVGASSNREKFGNKVLRCYLEYSRKAIPISKTQANIEGLDCIESLTALKASFSNIDPAKIGVSIVTSPHVTKEVLQEGIQLGYRHFFLQPGTTDASVEDLIISEKKRFSDLDIIEDCVLMNLPNYANDA